MGDFAKKGVQVVGVSMEEAEALTASNEGRKIELLSDKDGEISEFRRGAQAPHLRDQAGLLRPRDLPHLQEGRDPRRGARARTWRTSSRAPTPSRCSRPSTRRPTPGSASPPSSAEGGGAPPRAPCNARSPHI